MSFFDDAEDALEAQHKADNEASDATRYSPEPGDTINAVLLQARLYDGGEYDPVITITLRNVGEEEVGGIAPGASGRMFLSTVISRKMQDAAPAIGSPFILRYLGKVTPETGGNPYHDWTLVTPFTKDGDKASRDVELWESIKPEPGRKQPSPGEPDWKF